MYTGRRIEDVGFESSRYHCVCWSIIVFYFGLLPTLILSSLWSHLLAMFSILIFTSFFVVLFCFVWFFLLFFL